MFFLRSRALSLLFLFAGVWVFTIACDLTNPLEGIRAILNTKVRTTPVTILFTDTQTQNVIESPVFVEITGPNASDIIDLFNEARTEFVSDKGFVSFAIRDEIVPDSLNPIRFTVKATLPEYFEASVSIKLTEPRSTPIEISLLRQSDAFDDVIVGPIEDGVIPNDITLVTAPDPFSGTIASVLIKGGTKIETASGIPLDGSLRYSFVLFSNANANNLKSFPGGLSADVTNQNGDIQTVFFSTGGFFRLVLRDDSGRIAATLSEPALVRMEMANGTLTNTGTIAEAGQTVPIWSLPADASTGTWTFEGDATIGISEGSFLEASFETDHFSWWNAAWTSPVCSQGTVIRILNNNIRLRGLLFREANQSYMATFLSNHSDDLLAASRIRLRDVPAEIPAYIELYDIRNDLITTLSIPNPCSQQPIELDLGFLDTITILFRGVGFCRNRPNAEIRPSFPAWYKPATGGTWVPAGDVENGELEITLPGPDIYSFGGYYDSQFYEYTFDLSQASDGDIFEGEVDIPEQYCEQL
ncbi:MAG: hypothetical protein LAT67_07905 [Balneolales bacterium]|nr:hypothetical protein [Balneolales bacterium]